MFVQLSNEIAALREQLAARETELAEIKQLKAAPAQNGLPSNDQLKVSTCLQIIANFYYIVKNVLNLLVVKNFKFLPFIDATVYL